MDKKLLAKAIATHGINQLGIAQEELAELIQAISKFFRYRDKESELKIIEEMADVSIMLEQIKMLFNIPKEVLEDEIECKLDKLAMELEEGGY
jgi:NTP pyrophosphatase (non-canonical NTP hydrolase)